MSDRRNQDSQTAGRVDMPDVVRTALDRAHQLTDPDHSQDTGTHRIATHVGDISVAAVALTQNPKR
jgi:hypothetical protein